MVKIEENIRAAVPREEIQTRKVHFPRIEQKT